MILTFMRSILLLPKQGLLWYPENGCPIVMNMRTFLIRSFTEQLLEEGNLLEDIVNALDELYAEPDMYPTGECYSVIFD